MNSMEKQNPFSFVAEFDGDEHAIFDVPFGNTLEVLPLRDSVLFPGVVLPIAVGRPHSIDLVRKSYANNTIIATATQHDPTFEFPTGRDVYKYGVAARVVRIFDMPDRTISAIVQGLSPVKFTRFELNGNYNIVGSIEKLTEHFEEIDAPSYDIIKATLRDRLLEYVNYSEELGDEASMGINNAYHMKFFLNYVCSNIPLDAQTKISLLEEMSPTLRATSILKILDRDIKFAKLRIDIQRKTQADIDKQQRDYFLQQQLHNIQEQLGGATAQNDVDALNERAKKMQWKDDVAKVFNEELEKLKRLQMQSPDYQVQYNYLDTMLKLPWGIYTEDNLELKRAEKVLNADHYGLKEVKERILEHLAVRQYSMGKEHSTILCLYGPPGVGKTSLCKSIAAAMKRNYVRASLGGMHDEAEIRGHRRTYIGSMPGRIVKNLMKAGSANPVFVLDEIDKVTENTIHGDPSSALLEVLDPEQNGAFHDNFLEVDFDLSKVFFIATANNIGSIPRPLLDRMELIEVNGYITEEKIEIARKHLEPRVRERCGIQKSDFEQPKFTKPALEFLIENYTRESGVRNLEKELESYYRKAVLYKQRNYRFPVIKIQPEDVQQLLGKPKFQRDTYQGNAYAGVVTGLAWTSVGGEILFIESSLSRGKGQKLTLTGNLGDVMKESAMLALEYIKAHADELGIDMRIFDNYNIHVHVPEGAVPKDGPSAGITMTTSLVSALTQQKVRGNTAMTGEITLRGKVLPVGGIKEKILAAKRSGITDIILCKDNEKDIQEIDDMYLTGLTFHYVESIQDVLKFAILDEKVAHSIVFRFDEKDGNDTTNA